jgi:pimeloyl-ACP methyl ester carboxylesterase
MDQRVMEGVRSVCPRSHAGGYRLFVLLLVVAGLTVRPSAAAVLMAKNGMLLEGKAGYLPSIAENPLVVNVPAGGVEVRQVVLLDDGLRRTYLSWLQVQEDSLRESDPQGFERVRVRQNVASGNRLIGSVSAVLGVGPFDQWGRRTFSILTPRGRVDVVQGITEITPLYTRVEGLSGTPAIRWDCRVATSSIPRETLSQVLRQQGVEQGADARMQVVRLLFAAERYNDARIELEDAMREFPELASLKDLLVELRQLSAKRLIDEIELRQAAGQHGRVQLLLNHFPAEGVGTESLLRVSELLRGYQQNEARLAALRQALQQLVQRLKDPTVRGEAEGVADELAAQLGWNSMDRLADFTRLADDPQLLDESKLALLISGWVLGSGAASQNIVEALSVVRVRELVRRYLLSDAEAERAALLEQMGQEEGGTPQRVAQILQQLPPPLVTEPQPDRPPGNYLIRVPGLTEGEPFEYEVQLPDEYDPFRRYPLILTLHAGGRTAADQIDWWAGPYQAEQQSRLGQATRHGYIVVAPRWLKPNQTRYAYTGQEHAVVLACLRDACRRFAIDTDRVFLTGHSVGGDAAWDLGLAHPDLWAGVIPIVAVADYGPQSPKYVSQYWGNARYVPWYFVTGELDGNKLEMNRRDFDRYLKHSGYDVIIVEYIGRGHEHFYEEIHRLFTWMNLHRRNFYPEEFSCATMRNFDNFFWYLELEGLPSRSLVSPLAWPAPASTRPAMQEFRRTATNTLRIDTGAERARLWLSPDVIDLGGKITMTVNGRSRTYSVDPDVRTILDDVRTRADRQHPFWTRVDLVTGKRSSR